jgi:hypothetical protein
MSSNPSIMFSDRRNLRRWSVQLLVVWLFGVVMGVANACSLGESAFHRLDVAAAADSPAHHHGDERGDIAKVNCLDFCERSSIGVPQLKVVADPFAALGFAVPVLATPAVSGLAEPIVGRLVVDSPHLLGGPPPRIAFQRLAL